MVGWGRNLLVACITLLAATASAQASITPHILLKPNVHRNVSLSFAASPLPEGGYYYAVIVLEPYRDYTREHPPPCSVSSDMQRTDYGYPQAGKVSLALTPARSHTGRWCLGGSYEGAIYAVPPSRPCERTYSCEGERCASSPCRPLTGVVALPRQWAYPEPPPGPSSRNVRIVGWFVVRFHSH